LPAKRCGRSALVESNPLPALFGVLHEKASRCIHERTRVTAHDQLVALYQLVQGVGRSGTDSPYRPTPNIGGCQLSPAASQTTSFPHRGNMTRQSCRDKTKMFYTFKCMPQLGTTFALSFNSGPEPLKKSHCQLRFSVPESEVGAGGWFLSSCATAVSPPLFGGRNAARNGFLTFRTSKAVPQRSAFKPGPAFGPSTRTKWRGSCGLP